MRTVFYLIWLEYWTVHEMCSVPWFLSKCFWMKPHEECERWPGTRPRTQTTADTNGRSFKILLISDPTARHPLWRLLPRPNWQFSARLWPQLQISDSFSSPEGFLCLYLNRSKQASRWNVDQKHLLYSNLGSKTLLPENNQTRELNELELSSQNIQLRRHICQNCEQLSQILYWFSEWSKQAA